MRIRLSDDRRAALLRAVKLHFAKEFDDPIRDACGHVQDKLGDIEGEIYEPEPPR